MIRSIRERIYLTGILPLAALAVAIVGVNGAIRIEDARDELKASRRAAAELLHAPAVDALTVGNTLSFQRIASRAVKSSQAIKCIALLDSSGSLVVRAGDCIKAPTIDAIAVSITRNDLSDFPTDETAQDQVLGALHITMSDASIAERRHVVVWQLAASFLLVAAVIAVVSKLLRSRLVTPIERIDEAMRRVGQRDYSAAVAVRGNDELTRLGTALNSMIGTIAQYTEELQQRRKEADDALQEADEANLSRDALIQTLAVDLEAPLSVVYTRLTEIAIRNTDEALKFPIRDLLAVLQETQASLTDLLEVATAAQRKRKRANVSMDRLKEDVEADLRRLTDDAGMPIHVAFTARPVGSEASFAAREGMSIDSSRFRRAVAYVSRLMSRACSPAGVFITIQFIDVSPCQIYVSVQMTGVYGDGSSEEGSEDASPRANGVPPAILGWKDREIRVMHYLLREVGLSVSFGATMTGIVNVLLEMRADVAKVCRTVADIETLIVSEDPSVSRMATRGDLANEEVKVVGFFEAPLVAHTSEFGALVVDFDGQVADAFGVLDVLKAKVGRPRVLVALCPAGSISDALNERMFEVGFAAVVQKPIDYSRLRDVVRSAAANRNLAEG